MGGRSSIRSLVWLAFAGQLMFVVAWIVAGALEPSYSHVEEGVSPLAARDAEHPWIVTAGIVALGLSFVALAAALFGALSRRRLLPVALFGLAGVAIVLAAAFPLDCGFAEERCRSMWEEGELSWQTDAHLWADLVSQALLVLTPFALARALWPTTWGLAALVCGAVGLGLEALFVATWGDDGAAEGLFARIALVPLHAWVVIVGGAVLWATRSPRPPGELIPLRPRDFFAQGWTGRGEAMLRPFLLGRWFRVTFDIRRDATWASETVWRFDDEATFEGGRVERRRTWGEFVADDHVRLTAGDLPDGLDVWIEEGGFRLPPFRVTYPLGPVPVLVRCVDRSYVEVDGTFVNRFDVYTVGVPVPLARVTFRVRPVDPAPDAGSVAALEGSS